MDPLYQKEGFEKDYESSSGGEHSQLDDDMEDSTDPTLSTRIFTVLKYLQQMPNYAPVSFDRLLSEIGLDIELHADLKEALARNEKVKLTDTSISYKPKYQFRTLTMFMEALESHKSMKGITSVEVLEACQNESIAQRLMTEAVISGLVICFKSGRSTTDKVFFPRGKKFLTELSGTFKLVKNKHAIVCEDAEVTKEVNRGDAVFIGIEFLKAVREERYEEAAQYARRVSLSYDAQLLNHGNEQVHKSQLASHLFHNQSPFSATSMSKSQLEAEHKEITFNYKFTDTKLPLDPSLVASGQHLLQNKDSGELADKKEVRLYKFGCTNDIRSLWRKVSEKTCFKAEQQSNLLKEMVSEGLITREQIKEQNERTRIEIRSKRKKKRRRVARPIKISNTHMI